MKEDCKAKRAQFIDKSVKVRELFDFAHLEDQIAAIQKYCTSAYGSNLWNLDSAEAEMMFSAWRTGIKLSWDVNCACRT